MARCDDCVKHNKSAYATYAFELRDQWSPYLLCDRHVATLLIDIATDKVTWPAGARLIALERHNPPEPWHFSPDTWAGSENGEPRQYRQYSMVCPDCRQKFKLPHGADQEAIRRAYMSHYNLRHPHGVAGDGSDT